MVGADVVIAKSIKSLCLDRRLKGRGEPTQTVKTLRGPQALRTLLSSTAFWDLAVWFAWYSLIFNAFYFLWFESGWFWEWVLSTIQLFWTSGMSDHESPIVGTACCLEKLELDLTVQLNLLIWRWEQEDLGEFLDFSARFISLLTTYSKFISEIDLQVIVSLAPLCLYSGVEPITL